MSIFDTKRLILKNLTRNDLDDVYEQVYADPEVKKRGMLCVWVQKI